MHDVRATDAERDRVVAFLRDRCLEGCLDPEELEDRTRLALRARTRDALGAVVADLPGAPGALAPAAGAVAPPRRRPRLVPTLAVLAVLAVALPLVLPPELVVVAVIALIATLVLATVLLVSLAPWLAAGAGAVWAWRRLTRGPSDAPPQDLPPGDPRGSRLVPPAR